MDGFGRSQHRVGGFAARRRHPAFALLALLAVFLQAFVVQTHFHAVAPVSAGYEQHTDGDHEQHVSLTDEHRVSCALCQTLASAGAATLPSEAFVLAAERASQAAVIALAIAPRVHTHSWQSRAPPTFL
jgi:Protein of unknown function (DUF2946)